MSAMRSGTIATANLDAHRHASAAHVMTQLIAESRTIVAYAATTVMV